VLCDVDDNFINNLPWYFTTFERVNCLTGRWLGTMLLGVGKEVNVINKQDSEVVAFQFSLCF